MSTYLEYRRKFIEDGRPLPEKKVYKIKPVSEKRKKKLAEQNIKGDSALDVWFEERRKEMRGICSHCGAKSCKDSDEYYKFSIAHIFQKAYFKSVATHPSAWIELCFWGTDGAKSCHTRYDTGILPISQLNCFDEVVNKFQVLYPLMTSEEKRRLPDILMQYIGTDM